MTTDNYNPASPISPFGVVEDWQSGSEAVVERPAGTSAITTFSQAAAAAPAARQTENLRLFIESSDWGSDVEFHFAQQDLISVREQEIITELGELGVTGGSDLLKQWTEVKPRELGGWTPPTNMGKATFDWFVGIFQDKRNQDRMRALEYEVRVELPTREAIEVMYLSLYTDLASLVQTSALAVQQAISLGVELDNRYDTVEEVMAELAKVENIPPEEMEKFRAEVQKVIDYYAPSGGAPAAVSSLPGGVQLPPLEAPMQPTPSRPVSLHQLTTQEILDSMAYQGPPDTTVTQADWEDYLRNQLQYSEEDIENQYKIMIDEIVASWNETVDNIKVYREGMAEMPEYKWTDMLTTMVTMPTLAALDVVSNYFRWVSQPLAGLTYGLGFRTDMQREYWQQAIKGLPGGAALSEKDFNNAFDHLQGMSQDITAKTQEYAGVKPSPLDYWLAAGRAWEDWDAPFEGTGEWMLKYMVMEGLVDPLTYVGWGLATKVTRPLGAFGRVVKYAEHAAMVPGDVFANAVKGGLAHIPKTTGQKFIVYAAGALNNQNQAIKNFFPNKPWVKLTNAEMVDAAKSSIKTFLNNPLGTSRTARYGADLLIHDSLNEADVTNWLTKAFKTELSGDEIKSFLTADKLASLQEAFELNFLFQAPSHKILPDDEAVSLMLRILEIEPTDAARLTMHKIISARRTSIIANATSVFETSNNALHASKQWADKLYRHQANNEQSATALAMKDKGPYALKLAQVPLSVQRLWVDKIDRHFVKTFAEAYLTFGLYGPYNMMEDMLRSFFGGVTPHTMGVNDYAVSWGDLLGDPNMWLHGSTSEMYGHMAKSGLEEGWSNYLLQGFGLWRGTGEKIYTAMVRKPGEISQAFRWNYVDKRAIQILMEDGGDIVQQLVKAIGPSPEFSDAELGRMVAEYLHRAVLTGRVEVVEEAVNIFTHRAVKKKNLTKILSEHPDLPPEGRVMIENAFDEGMLNTPEGIEATIKNVDKQITDLLLKSPDVATVQMQELSEQLMSWGMKNTDELAQAMIAVKQMADTQGVLPERVLGEVTASTRGMNPEARGQEFLKAADKINNFTQEAGASIENVVEKIKASLANPDLSPAYRDSAQNYIDLLTSMSASYTKFSNEEMATRAAIFATKPKKVDHSWWQNFYQETLSRHKAFNRQMDDLRIKVHEASKAIDSITNPKPARPPVRVEGRQLAPQDIATLLGVRMDDITSNMLSVLSLQGDREFFIKYVMTFVKEGDIGFSPETVGVAYDQIIRTLKVSDRTIKMTTALTEQTEAVRVKIHELYLAGAYDEADIAKLGTHVDEVAGRMKEVMYEPGAAPMVRDQVGYRAGKPQATKGYMATEGEGMYIARSRAAAENFEDATTGKVKEIKYTEPKNPYVFQPGDDLYVLMESDQLFEPIKELDSPWLKANKQAIIDAGATNENFNTVIEDINKAISDNMQKQGYDALISPGQLLDGEAGDMIILYDKALWGKPPAPPSRVVKPGFGTSYQDLRQSSLDKAMKQYYKEFPDYTHQNALDAMMKTIYPFWTYESQRWIYLPRLFMQKPGLGTEFLRYQDNSDKGYIPLYGDVQFNPLRGTVFGTVSTRLFKRDYPEYYDRLGGVVGTGVQVMDALSRYGFYPGAHIGLPLALLGGLSPQTGEVLPSIINTPLSFLMAAFPDSEAVNTLTETIFPTRYRDYLVGMQLTADGYDGSLIMAKIRDNRELTEEETSAWAEARRRVGIYQGIAEQFGIFRMRPEEMTATYEAAEEVITEMTGFTADQQTWLSRHGYKIWDIVGGLSDANQAVLEEMDYYRWSGITRPLLPSRQQIILDRNELDWNDVALFIEGQNDFRLQIESELKSGVLGPDAYNAELADIFEKTGEYIENKQKENPYMTWEGKLKYYEEFGVAIPVQHPMDELKNLYFSVKLDRISDPETGEMVYDWDSFYAYRQYLTDAIPEHLRGEWDSMIQKNMTDTELVRHAVYNTYFRKYYDVTELTIEQFPENEQAMIRDYQSFNRRGINLDRQAEIKAYVSEFTGLSLISSFQSNLGTNRQALRYKNPHLDAWLYYWGRTDSFLTDQAAALYPTIARQTGRSINK